MSPTPIELLSPARNLECGLAAIDHGADAVYIGAPRFGARAAASNSVDDIRRLCDYAHLFAVRVYVTLNTILYDDELAEAERLVWQLYEVGADALIVQDMALLKMNLPPIPLHASTQMDNRTPQKVRWLTDLGYEQVVLARELSLSQIQDIHRQVPEARLEAFVHGALCVSLSGRCHASQYCFGRSANRGECAQFCRLPFSLVDADGRVLMRDKYLLSLRDMNRSRSLEAMMDAGVSSFKIEGRLKDVSYVKNVTAYYRQRIDEILARRPEYVRSSWGDSTLTFHPDPERSFSRGFTEYFLHGDDHDIASPDTPKSRGPQVGVVSDVRPDHLVVSATASFANGDGLCFSDRHGRLQGFRVNRAQGNRLYPAQMPVVERGTPLFRSHDQQWEQLLAGPTARRRVPLNLILEETPDGFRLTAQMPDGRSHSVLCPAEKQLAQTPQADAIRQTLSRLGDTVYEAQHVDLRFSQTWFIPRSQLADWRRRVVEVVQKEAAMRPAPAASSLGRVVPPGYGVEAVNVSNRLAASFYAEQGIPVGQTALEVRSPKAAEPQDDVLMYCRHCLRRELGECPREGSVVKHGREPYYLLSQDGRRFLLQFNCKDCLMLVRHA